jgi:site-specific DNA recombinase
MPSWGISLRPGQHQALVSASTWQRIQERLSGGFYAPRKNNVSDDFPLRGYVECDDCGTPLTACWSKGSHQKHPYYLCPKRGCASYGKSIRRAKIESEFEEVLQSLTPGESMMKVAEMMFRDCGIIGSHKVRFVRKQRLLRSPAYKSRSTVCLIAL